MSMRILFLALSVCVAVLVSASKVMALTPCPLLDPPNSWTDCTAKLEVDLLSTYDGAFKNGKFHGFGTLTHNDGSIKKGYWKNGKLVRESTGESSFALLKDDKLYLIGGGTGFAVSESGHIVTNHHVMGDCDLVEAMHQGKEIELSTVFVDKNNDLALLKGGLKPARIFKLSRQNPKLMEEIFVAGYPSALNTTVKVTKGVVSSLTGSNDNLSEFQLDAAINSGSSGGPVFNAKGNVVGVVVSAKLSEITHEDLVKASKGKRIRFETTQSQNYGIKSSVVLSLLESSGVEAARPNKGNTAKDELRKIINNATYELKCWASGKRIKAAKMK
jgi:S1-C subfamily serine protease